jgi:hypothetical protein
LRGNKRPFSALIACFAILGMIAGGAVAFPARFHAIVSKAQEVLDRGGGADARDAAAYRSNSGSGTNGRAVDTPDCQTSISGILDDPPGTQDVHGLQHAIAVVEADCRKNADARGLLNALTHMLANARKHADHPSRAGGNGKGPGNGNGHGNGHGNGVGHDPPGGGHGHGHAYGHGTH